MLTYQFIGAQLDFVGVQCEPSTVGETSANLYVQTTVKTQIPASGHLKLILPASGEVSIKQGTLTCSITGDVNQNSLTCSASGTVITVLVKSSIGVGSTIQLNVIGALTTPTSSVETSSFTFQTLAADSVTMLDSLSTGITLTVSPDSFTSVLMTQIDSTVVGQTTSVLVTIQVQNQLLAGAILKLKFPKWNPSASTNQQTAMISNPANVQCTSRTNVNSNVNCAFDTSTDTLTVQNGFPTGQVAGTTIQFVLATIKNPLSYSPISIQVHSLNSAGTGTIESGTISFAASTPASISSSSAVTSADVTTVQEYANFRLEFTSPVPLSAGSVVTVVFPQQFSFESKLSIVQGFGLFGSIKNLNFTADNLSVKLASGIDSYKAAGIAGILIFQQIKNPSYVKQTDSFSIYLTDSNGFQIAQVTTNVAYTPTVGTVDSATISTDSLTVNSKANLTLRFQPKHKLSSSSIINIQLPSNIEVSCDNFKASGGFSSSMTCTESTSNLFIFTSPFAISYTYSSSTFLQIIFVNIINPNSAQIVKGLSLSTYERVVVIGGIQNFQVDSYTDTTTTLYTVLPSQFLSQSISVNTNETYTDAIFTFTIILDNAIPQNGKLIIVIPSEVSITNTVKCTGLQNIASTLSCTLNSQNLTITNGFASGSIASQQTVKFSLSGLRTPLSTITSSTFKIYSMDSNGFQIDEVLSLLTVTMLQGKKISSMSAKSNSNTVASSAQLTLSVKPPLPLQNGDQLFFTIPDSVTPPTKSNLACSGSDSLKSSLTCQINGHILIVNVSLSTSPSTANSSIFTVNLNPINNPKSTKTTDEFQLVVKDKNGYAVAQTNTGNGAQLQVGTPSVIKSANFTALDARQLAFTTITVKFSTNNLIPAGGYLVVDFNILYFSITQNSLTKCTSNLVKNDNVTYKFVRDSQFQVRDIFPKDYVGQESVDFTINNVNIKTVTKTTTPSWTVTTYTPDGYMIDRVSDYLTLTFPCNSPCLTCPTNNPNQCLSCNVLSGSTILYNNKCLSQCPDGQYYNQNQYQCLPCDTKCKTCNSENPSECYSCNVKSALYPYLDGNTCTDTCAFGYYANNNTAACDKCSSPCASCLDSATVCSSCDLSSNLKYLNVNQCLATCPSGTFLDSNNVCQKCDPNCLTCSGSGNTCTSCQTPNLLSQYSYTCVDTCPFGKTIYNPLNKVCELCDPTCQTCENKKTFCTSCAQSLNLLTSTGVCNGECSTDKKLVGFNGVCTACETQCVTCVNNPSSCLSCRSTEYLYDYSCVKTCPSGYEPDDYRQCVINSLRCPFGQQVNAQGTACVLKAQICENDFRLNAAKDRCVPGPGHYAPFPLCFACLFLSLIIIVSWIKYKQTLVISNIIAVVSLIETIGILMLVILSYQMGVYSTFALALIAILFLYGCNLFFAVVFVKQVSTDQAFKYWGLSYKITSNIVIVIGSLLNFKVYRVIYGRFFGKDHFNAAFEDPEHFFKPFTFISVFSIVTTMLPLLVSCITGMVFIDYGYQVEMTCIELFIIEIALLIMMIYEKIKLRKYALKQNQYLKVQPKFLDNSQVNVMSSLIDEQTNSYSLKAQSLHTTTTLMGLNTYDSKKLKTATNKTDDDLLHLTSLMLKQEQEQSKITPEFKEYYERRRLLEKLISKIYSKDATISKGDTIKLINKLQEDEILRFQQRLCRSFRDCREADNDFADQDAGDPELQNFISAPVSPREKQMLHNPFFQGRLGEFKKAMKQRDQFDNCYAEGKPAHYFPMRDTKLITVKVQTNLLELLAIDDLTRTKTQNLKYHDSSEEEYIEENLNSDYAQGLIDGVLDAYTEHEFTKQRRRLPRARLAQIPNFDLTDIIGDFEIDSEGYSLIIKGRDGKLNDREGRKVNKKGYLIDIEGNIITARNILIFRFDEIDSDDEIPAPFCFEKKKESLFKIEDITTHNKKNKKKNIMNEEDEIEIEYRKLREKNASHNSSVDSLMGENPSKYNKQNKRVMPGDEDGFLSKIVQPMQAKSKNELLKVGSDNLRANNNQGTQRTNRNYRNQNLASDSGLRTQEQSPSKQINAQIEVQTVKLESIGGYDTSIQGDQSARDLFFSAFAFQSGINKNVSNGRTQQNNIFGGMGQSQSTQFNTRNLQNNSALSNDYTMSTNKERINKIKMLRESLGSNQEDLVLLQQLQKFEQGAKGRQSVQEPTKTTLAKKNLSRIYGKVQDKIHDITDYHKPQFQLNQQRKTFSQAFFDEDNLKINKKPMIQDSRLKNLENIYLKGVNKDRRTASQLNRKRTQNQSAWDIDQGFSSGGGGTGLAPGSSGMKYRAMQHSLLDTAIESSDQDEMRMRQQLDKMQAIIDKGQKANPKAIKIPKANKNIFNGGWV